MPGEHIWTHLDSSVLDHAKRYCKGEDVEVWGQPGERSPASWLWIVGFTVRRFLSESKALGVLSLRACPIPLLPFSVSGLQSVSFAPASPSCMSWIPPLGWELGWPQSRQASCSSEVPDEPVAPSRLCLGSICRSPWRYLFPLTVYTLPSLRTLPAFSPHEIFYDNSITGLFLPPLVEYSILE